MAQAAARGGVPWCGRSSEAVPQWGGSSRDASACSYQVHTNENTPTALSESAASGLVDALRIGDGTDAVRELAREVFRRRQRARLVAATASLGESTRECCRAVAIPVDRL